MKKLLTIFLFLLAFHSNAQRTLFGGNNNYIKPVVASQTSATVTSGLVLHLDASNSASYPGSGATWTNLVTGNAVTNLTLNGSIAYNAANGGVLRFPDGSYASTASTFGRLAKYTIEIWVKLAGTSAQYPSLFAETAPNGNSNMILSYNTQFGASHQYTSGFNIPSGWKVYTTTSNTSDLNSWVHIVATYDGNNCTIYKNGIAIGTEPIGTNPLTSNAGYLIGKRWDRPDYAYGDYAIVKLYNQDLTSSEVSTNFNALKSRFGF